MPNRRLTTAPRPASGEERPGVEQRNWSLAQRFDIALAVGDRFVNVELAGKIAVEYGVDDGLRLGDPCMERPVRDYAEAEHIPCSWTKGLSAPSSRTEARRVMKLLRACASVTACSGAVM